MDSLINPISCLTTGDDFSVRLQLLRECKAMADYAFASGREVPGTVAEALESFASQMAGADGMSAIPDGESPKSEAVHTSDKAVSQNSPGVDARRLAQMHARLTEIVAPATPRTILLMATESAKEGFWLFLGPVPLIRRMLVMAIAALITLIAVSLTDAVNGNPDSFSYMHNSGVPLLLNELFLLSAAAIGACFSALFQANRYIREGSFDPAHESSYWIRFVLGLLAGIMLASLIDIENYIPETGGVAASASLKGLGKPTVALLGGFSAAVVHRILHRLITTVDSLVRGDVRDMIATREQAAKTRLAEQTVKTRLQLSAKLTKLQQQISAGANPDELREALNQIQNGLMSSGLTGAEDEAEFPAKRKAGDATKAGLSNED